MGDLENDLAERASRMEHRRISIAEAAEAMAADMFGKIDKPGVYDISIEEHHGDCCVGPSISSTGLRTIARSTLAHYYSSSIYNPLRVEEPDKDEWRIGRAVHTLVAEPETFHKLFIQRPAIYENWLTKASKAWRTAAEADGYDVLSDKEWADVHGMGASLASHPFTAHGLFQGQIEKSLIWQDKKTGIWLKARPDVIPAGENMMVDLKTVQSAAWQDVHRSVFSLRYDMQAALSVIGMQEVLGREVDSFVLACVEKTRPYPVRLSPIHPETIDLAKADCRMALDKFANAMQTGEWPGWEDQDGEWISRSEKDMERLIKETQAGLRPKGW